MYVHIYDRKEEIRKQSKLYMRVHIWSADRESGILYMVMREEERR